MYESVNSMDKVRHIYSELKKTNKRLAHNFFINDELLKRFISRGELFFVRSEMSCIFLRHRQAGYQMYILSADLFDLPVLLQKIKMDMQGNRLIADLPGGNKQLEQILRDNEFEPYAILQRMVRINLEISAYSLPKEIRAKIEEISQIREILCSVFDDVSDQLLMEDSLVDFIKAGRVIVYRDEQNGRVASIIIFENVGQMIHWRYWATAPQYLSQNYGMKLFHFYEQYLGNFRRQVLFAHKDNSVTKLHERLGFRADGFEDKIFVWQV